MKSLMHLLSAMLHDCSITCCTTTTRDLITITRRVENEGLSFLTITLGNYAQDFERGLEKGYLDASSFRAFGKKGLIPKLFSGMVRQVFDDSGALRDKPSIASIRCIRQVCRMWKKILLPCTGERTSKALEDYISLDQALSSVPDRIPKDLFDLFGKVSDLLWCQVLAGVQDSLLDNSLVPRHGRGAVAEKLLPNQKYSSKRWHTRLDHYFPVADYRYSSINGFLENVDMIELVSPEQEQPVRVVTVPKTQKAPRVIAVEPECMQYTQQAILQRLVPAIESHPLTRGKINFRNQGVNATLAKESSSHGLLSTLDLSEASDRVHAELVHRLLRSVPELRDGMFACRSTRASVDTRRSRHFGRDSKRPAEARPEPLQEIVCGTRSLPSDRRNSSHEVIVLQKFASMGSALCFPVESMVFYTLLAVAGLHRKAKRQINSSHLFDALSGVYVYGDDIVCPAYMVPSVLYVFEAFGLKVNAAKSFWTGKFRESCGMDAYDGENVTPVYIRRLYPKDRTDVQGLVSWVSLSNQLLKAGFPCGAHRARDMIESIRSFPDVSDTASCIGYIGFDRPKVSRWNKELQRPEVKGLVAVPRKHSDQISGWDALTKWFLSSSIEEDRDRYERSGSFGSLALKSRWCPIY